VAVIDLGKPDGNPEDYTKFEIANISIFIPDRMTDKSTGIEISVSKFLAWKKLMLERY